MFSCSFSYALTVAEAEQYVGKDFTILAQKQSLLMSVDQSVIGNVLEILVVHYENVEETENFLVIQKSNDKLERVNLDSIFIYKNTKLRNR